MEHKKTETAIKGIEETLKSIKIAKDAMTGDLERINTGVAHVIYTEEYKEKQRSELKERFEKLCLSKAHILETFAEDVVTAEMELEAQPINVNDTTLCNTISMINSMGDNLPLEQQRDIAKQFSGDYAAEKCLQALYIKLGLSYVITLTNAEALTRELFRAVIAFNHSKEKSASDFRAIERASNNILDAFNSPYKMNIDVSEEAFMEQIHAMSGLKMTK